MLPPRAMAPLTRGIPLSQTLLYSGHSPPLVGAENLNVPQGQTRLGSLPCISKPCPQGSPDPSLLPLPSGGGEQMIVIKHPAKKNKIKIRDVWAMAMLVPSLGVSTSWSWRFVSGTASLSDAKIEETYLVNFLCHLVLRRFCFRTA